jgi:hypothetical protein
VRDDEDAIKGLLGKAFGQEPALTLDREEIFRRGRRGVRLRRFAASGGVAAAVVAVVLGAAALNNLPGDGKDISPAQSAGARPPYPPLATSSESAPAGPQLPLSTTTAAPGDQHAGELTKLVAASGAVPGGVALFPAEPNRAPLTFAFVGDAYRATATLSDAKGQGVLIIELRRAVNGASVPRCPQVPDCAELNQAGVAMAARTAKNSTGSVEYSVDALRPDGTTVFLIASNMASIRPDETKPTRALPVVDLAKLREIAALPRLTFG